MIMVKRKMLVFCLVILSIGSGCGVSKSGTAGKQTGGVCASVPFVSEEPVISWTKFGMGKKHSDSLPQKFSSYLMDQNQLDSFFAYVRKPGFRASFSVPFPEPLGCQYFEVTNANTMAPGLVEKYPQFVSLKGTG